MDAMGGMGDSSEMQFIHARKHAQVSICSKGYLRALDRPQLRVSKKH